MIRTRRAYEGPKRGDGKRFLVDRLWPRGVRKADLELDAWLKEIAPSASLRKWFGHDPERWQEFGTRYRKELDRHRSDLDPLLDAARKGNVTLLFGAKDTEHNNAVVLKRWVEEHL